MHATGTFQVAVKPAEASEIGKAAGLGRMTIDKVWSGDIEGTSKGEMTTTAVGTTMAYVALETMNVKINGKSGTFVFSHKATMDSTNPKSGVMEVSVLPNTGTGDLKGIEGTLQIAIDKSGHSYDFTYTLPAQ
ncbi:DUF3224 domain-containing protein [Terriglobus sp. RCC_193]|uniref:DUF3224 domain-containing protein n=1 Tax=Terriglobus sp. RCC_193 TaxID=3239218 RepID=UPI003523731A